MTERPILMTPENAQKCHDGTKTQTRRTSGLDEVNAAGSWFHPQMTRPGVWTFLDSSQANPYNNTLDAVCPYGVVGDRLWIREAFCVGKPAILGRVGIIPYYGKIKGAHDSLVCKTVYQGAWGKSDPPKWRPSLHMNRRFSRTVAEIAALRVERLQEITEEDVIAEGVNRIAHGRNGYYYSAFRDVPHHANWIDPVDAYKELWESINGKGFWAVNPWVWVVSFTKVQEA